jgi:SET domain-containing protein
MQHTLQAPIEVRVSETSGRGVFATQAIPSGTLLAPCTGTLRTTAELTPEMYAMMIGLDLWLTSPGEQVDDFFNHSCEPNVGFPTGEAAFFALRDIAPGEELCWDYSTSMTESGWTMPCLCGTPSCRGTIGAFQELPVGEQQRLLPHSLEYIRQQYGERPAGRPYRPR